MIPDKSNEPLVRVALLMGSHAHEQTGISTAKRKDQTLLEPDEHRGILFLQLLFVKRPCNAFALWQGMNVRHESPKTAFPFSNFSQ